MVIAGTHSGVGKTTVATGLMAALRARGLRVGAAKVGPDFIDPGYHSLATGRPSHNLDAWMNGMESISPLALRASAGAELLVIEGVMGLFDGASDATPSSTAEIALTLEAPIVLVLDAASASTSVAAVVHGFATFDSRVRLAGVILNRVGSDSHEAMLRSALAPLDIPVLGVLRRDDALVWRDRHLGLVPVIEQPDAVGTSLERLAALVARGCDLDAIMSIAGNARPMAAAELAMPAPVGHARIAVAAGAAFSFSYQHNLEALRAAGAELIPFDPLHERHLPQGVTGLIAGGGFPEVYAAALSENVELLADVRQRIDNGLVVWAECGGLLWLCRSLDGRSLVGAFDVDAVMTNRLTLGYREVRTKVASPLGAAGTGLRGHEFHYSRVEPTGSAMTLKGREGSFEAGFATPRVLASYLHVHLGSRPDVAEHFVRACITSARTYPADALLVPYIS